MIPVQLPFHCAGIHPVLLSNLLIAYSISAFPRNSIIEPGVASLPFANTDAAAILHKSPATTPALESSLPEPYTFSGSIPAHETEVSIPVSMGIQALPLAMRTNRFFCFKTYGIFKFALTIKAISCNLQVLQIHNTGHGRSYLLHAQCFSALS